jgi:prepilin-type N-terminal cleavage/methylation domain-containing protein
MRSAGRLEESGFTLLEVLMTLAILAVGITLTLSLISGTLANIRKVQLRTRTIQHAETVMELALLDDSIRRPTAFGGDFEDGTRWTVQVGEFQMPDTRPPNPQQRELPVKLFAFTVEVIGPDSRMPDFRLQTLKIINIQEPGRPVQLPR